MKTLGELDGSFVELDLTNRNNNQNKIKDTNKIINKIKNLNNNNNRNEIIITMIYKYNLVDSKDRKLITS